MSSENSLMGSRWANKEQWGWTYDTYIDHADGLDFLKAMLVCTKGDGVISKEEREWVLGFAACREMPMSMIEEARAYDADEDITDIMSRNPIVKKGKKARSIGQSKHVVEMENITNRKKQQFVKWQV